MMAAAKAATTFVFGQHRANASQVFFRSRLSLGLVNLKPVVKGPITILQRECITRLHVFLLTSFWAQMYIFYPFPFAYSPPSTTGHVLVIPKRRALRFQDLEPAEVSDLWLSVQQYASNQKSARLCCNTDFMIELGVNLKNTTRHRH
jgi:hypothetical protein